jgi:hypothetical protein
VAAGLVVVVIVAVMLVGVPGGKGSPGPSPATGTYRLPASAVAAVEAVPVRALVGNARAQLGGGQVTAPEKLPPGAPRLSARGHPEVVFVCAEYWRLCAAERWALVMALSKFGMFGNLAGTTSSSRDASPSTPTFSFYGATYSSRYLTLVTRELETNRYNPAAREYPLLQFPTQQEMRLISDWDVAPYTTKTASIPFAYLGGGFILTGAQYDASAISRMKFPAAAKIMTSGKTAVSRLVEAAAGYLVGDLCALTHDQPRSVCAQVPPSLIGITTSAG